MGFFDSDIKVTYDTVTSGVPDDYECCEEIACPNCGDISFVYFPNRAMWRCRSCSYESFSYDDEEFKFVEVSRSKKISILDEDVFSDLGGFFPVGSVDSVDGDDSRDDSFDMVGSIKDLG